MEILETLLSKLGCHGIVNVDVKCKIKSSRYVDFKMLAVIAWTVLKLFNFKSMGPLGVKSLPRSE